MYKNPKKLQFLCTILTIMYYSHQHVSATVVAIFSMILLQEYRSRMWLVMSLSLHNN